MGKIIKSGLFVLMCLFSVIIVACDKNKDEVPQNNQVENPNVDSNATIMDSNATIVDSNMTSSVVSNVTIAGTTNAITDSTKSDISKEDTSTKGSTTAPQASATNAANLYKKCIACHGVKGDKIAPGSVGDVLIANLSKDSIIESLKGYKARTLSKGGTAAIMYLQASNLSDSDMEALGEYISNFNK